MPSPLPAPLIIRIAAALLIAAEIGACTRKPLPKPEPPASTPAPTPVWHSLLRLCPQVIDPAATPRPPRDLSAIEEMFGPPKTPEAATRQARELEQQYRNEREYVNRVEVIYRLADASSPQARQVLTQLFHTEKDLDLRVQMVSALPFVDSEDLTASLLILQEALQTRQPRELREAALDTIQSLNDPKTLPTLQSALIDPDPELRETAVQTFEYLQEIVQMGVR